MSGPRSFDDDRWPDQEGFACCFVCGRRVDPRDPGRGTFTMKADSCDPLPAHLSCLEGYGGDGMKTTRIQVAYMTALNQMTKHQIIRSRQQASVSIVPLRAG